MSHGFRAYLQSRYKERVNFPEVLQGQEPRGAVVVPVWIDNGAPVTTDLPVPEDLSRRIADAVSFSQAHGFKAGVADTAVIPDLEGGAAEAIVLAGIGPRAEVGAEDLRRAAGAAVRRLSEYEVVTLALHHALQGDAGQVAALEGALLATYSFDEYKTTSKEARLRTISVLEGSEAAIERGRIGAEATAFARDLINEPASTLTPTELGRRASRAAEEAGSSSEVFDEKALAEKGCGGILGVGKGSITPPRLIHLSYAPEGATSKVALVGKGITFDSGGLSIKDAKSMETMKTDMSGAAAVIAATCAAARLGIPIGVEAWIPAAENMLGDAAMKPGDVLTHHGGHTTEVLNTDAEGRLVLADALSIACEGKPDAIVDIATLTGSMVVALGKKISGLFATTDALRDEILAAGDAAGEKLWPFPIFEPYRRELDSEVADQKNVATRWGGAIFATLFLSTFVDKTIPWAHLDIAGTARSESDSGYFSKGGTGVGARTFLNWLETRASR